MSLDGCGRERLRVGGLICVHMCSAQMCVSCVRGIGAPGCPPAHSLLFTVRCLALVLRQRRARPKRVGGLELMAASATKALRKYKLVFIGDQAVGKTSIISSFMYGTFDSHYASTIGIGAPEPVGLRRTLPITHRPSLNGGLIMRSLYLAPCAALRFRIKVGSRRRRDSAAAAMGHGGEGSPSTA